jgi:hypothetical protein
MQAIDLLTPMGESWKDFRFLLLLIFREACKPGVNELLPADALFYLAVKPVLEVSVLVEISESAEP